MDKSQNRTTMIGHREKDKKQSWDMNRNLGYWNWINNYFAFRVLSSFRCCCWKNFLFLSLLLWFHEGFVLLLRQVPSNNLWNFSLKNYCFSCMCSSENLLLSPSPSTIYRPNTRTLFSRLSLDYRWKIMRHEKHVMFVKFMRYGYTRRTLSLQSLGRVGKRCPQKVFASTGEGCELTMCHKFSHIVRQNEANVTWNSVKNGGK